MMTDAEILNKFLLAYADNPRLWGLLDPGQHQSLFDALLVRADTADAEVKRLRAKVVEARDLLADAEDDRDCAVEVDRANRERYGMMEAERDALLAQVTMLRSMLKNIDDNLRMSRNDWTARHSDVARQRIAAGLADALVIQPRII